MSNQAEKCPKCGHEEKHLKKENEFRCTHRSMIGGITFNCQCDHNNLAPQETLSPDSVVGEYKYEYEYGIAVQGILLKDLYPAIQSRLLSPQQEKCENCGFRGEHLCGSGGLISAHNLAIAQQGGVDLKAMAKHFYEQGMDCKLTGNEILEGDHKDCFEICWKDFDTKPVERDAK